jgi:hypothetical protein
MILAWLWKQEIGSPSNQNPLRFIDVQTIRVLRRKFNCKITQVGVHKHNRDELSEPVKLESPKHPPVKLSTVGQGNLLLKFNILLTYMMSLARPTGANSLGSLFSCCRPRYCLFEHSCGGSAPGGEICQLHASCETILRARTAKFARN